MRVRLLQKDYTYKGEEIKIQKLNRRITKTRFDTFDGRVESKEKIVTPVRPSC